MSISDWQGVLVWGPLHPGNERGLTWLCAQLKLSYVSIGSLEALESYPGRWLVLTPQHLVPNVYANKLVLSGPAIMPHDMPQDIDSSVVFNSLCSWVREMVQGVRPTLRCVDGPFPLPLDQLVPDPALPKDRVVLYVKYRDPSVAADCEAVLKQHCPGTPVVVVRYEAGYDFATYIDHLKRARWAVFLVGSESQGFAVQEAMALDVPIVRWDVRSLQDLCYWDRWFDRPPYRGVIPATGFTLWDDTCGLEVHNLEELAQAVTRMPSLEFHPRALLTRELSAQKCWDRWVTGVADALK